MTAANLLADLTALGIELQAHGDRLRYAPRSAMTPDLAERIRAHKRALLQQLRAGPSPAPDNPSDASDEYNEANWQAITDADLNYLLGPRDWPGPCPWCGGRLAHSRACNELRREWVPVIPFGKHRGRRADQLPAGYIDWIFSKSVGSEQFRAELRKWQQSDTTRPNNQHPV